MSDFVLHDEPKAGRTAAWQSELLRKVQEVAQQHIKTRAVLIPPSVVLQPPRSWHSAWASAFDLALFAARCSCPDLEREGLLKGKMCRNGHWGFRRISAAPRRDALAELVAEAVELERIRSARRSHRQRRRR